MTRRKWIAFIGLLITSLPSAFIAHKRQLDMWQVIDKLKRTHGYNTALKEL